MPEGSEEKKERPKIEKELKEELLKKTSEDGYHSIEEAAAKLEGKIPTKKPKEEDE